jgi:tripartite ATP-independent transporter DctP family solute receptor
MKRKEENEMKRIAFQLVTVILLFVVISSISQAAEKIIKISHPNDVTSPYQTAAEFFAKRVSELTNGKIEVQIYPSSQLGSLRESMEAVQMGTLEMVITNSAVAASFVKDFNIFNLPFLYRDFQHLYKVMDSDLGEEINLASQKKGLRIVGWWAGGSRSVYASRPIGDLASMQGIKIRTMQNPALLETWKTLGLIPTPIPFKEVYSALQQGVVEAGEGSVISYEGMKFYEVAPYLSYMKYVITVTPFMISEKYFKSLTKEHQAAIIQAAKESVAVERKVNEQKEVEIIERLKKMKEMNIVVPDREPFVAGAQPVIEKYGKNIGIEKLKAIQNLK